MNPDPLDSGVDGPETVDANLPVEGAGSRNAPVARQPMEQIARAMQAQAELMKQMHERQRMLEDVVKDNRRHELVINSAQALNESFQGLQRVQERLADKLDESGGTNRARFAVIGLGLLALAAVGALLVWKITEGADNLNSNLKSALDPRARDQARDQEMLANLSKLESRVKGVEEADRAAFRDEIERLRKGLQAIESERETLRRERDSGREELGVAKASIQAAQTEAAETKTKMQALEKDNARLTAEGVAHQKTLVQLNDMISSFKEKGPPPVKPDDASAKKPAVPEPPPATEATPTPPPVAPPVPVSAKSEPESAAPVEALASFPVSQMESLNAMLKSHSGSDRYEIKRADKVGQGKLWNVVMEVQGPNGKITKTIEAESLSFSVADKLLDVLFEGGSVTFHQGTGKSVKSTFFNNRYSIVVLGVNGKDWIGANLGFVKAK